MVQESFENGGGNDPIISGTFFSCGNIERSVNSFCQIFILSKIKKQKNARGSTKLFVSTYIFFLGILSRFNSKTNFDFRFGIINLCFAPF
jgi:hypothetical protein